MKIAIVGTHGSGKTIISFDLFTYLKKAGRSVNIMPEVARNSPFLAAGERSPDSQMHLFASQVENELRNQRGYDILIADRSVLDILMYTELFFPQSKQYIEAMRQFSKQYVHTYNFMFRTTIMYDPTEIKDHIRPKERDLQLTAHNRLTRILDEFYPDYIKLPEDAKINPVDFILKRISNQI